MTRLTPSGEEGLGRGVLVDESLGAMNLCFLTCPGGDLDARGLALSATG